MDDSYGRWQEIFIVLLLIGVNGVFSMLEMAVVSARKTRLEQKAEAGDRHAAYILQLAQEPTDFLSTVQIGITLVGIGTGVYSGATLAEPLAAVLGYVLWLAPYAGVLAYTFVVALVTYLSIILGELLPKRIAISNPEKIALICAPVISFLVKAFSPLTALLSFSTKYILRALGTRPNEEPPVTEDEVRLLIEQGAAKGVFNMDEQRIIESAFELDQLRVEEIMTPRTKISWLNVQDDSSKHLAQIAEKGYSCFIVADEDLDNVLGIVYTKRFLLQGLEQQDYSLQAALKEPLYVPETMCAQKLVNLFKQKHVKVALVVNEFGSLAGMVTLRDVVEHLLGDIPSYDEEYQPKISERGKNSWLVDGLLSISEFVEYFDLDEQLVEDSKELYNTVGGLVVDLLGSIPQAGVTIQLADLTLEVVDMDGNRVDKILVSKSETSG